MGGFAIDYEHDSEEIVALKKHIANQGMCLIYSCIEFSDAGIRQQVCGT